MSRSHQGTTTAHVDVESILSYGSHILSLCSVKQVVLVDLQYTHTHTQDDPESSK